MNNLVLINLFEHICFPKIIVNWPQFKRTFPPTAIGFDLGGIIEHGAYSHGKHTFCWISKCGMGAQLGKKSGTQDQQLFGSTLQLRIICADFRLENGLLMWSLGLGFWSSCLLKLYLFFRVKLLFLFISPLSLHILYYCVCPGSLVHSL